VVQRHPDESEAIPEQPELDPGAEDDERQQDDHRPEQSHRELRWPGCAISWITRVVAREAVADAAELEEHGRNQDEPITA